MSLGPIAGVPVIEHGSKKEQVEQNTRRAGLLKTSSSFAHLLGQAEGHAVCVRSDGEGSHGVSLSKEALLEFLRDQQREMNLRLLDSLIGREEKQRSALGILETISAGDMRKGAVNEASKYRQEDSKNDTPVVPEELAPIIRRASEKYGVDPGLIQAVIKAESSFRPRSTSPKGAMGLMQLMPETAREVGVKDPYDPFENIMGGTRYLKGLLDRYQGNIPLALAAYNWGAGNVEKHPAHLPRETRDYIKRVTQEYRLAKA